MSPRVSIIVPMFNGAELVPECHAALSPVLDQLEGGAEVIYVDDGSSDDTMDMLRRVQATDPRVRIVELAANFGQHAAFTAGFEHAQGRYLVTLDADLQCDPADIPRLIEPLTRGYDLVSGVRVNRQDPGARRLFSRATTSIVSRLAGSSCETSAARSMRHGRRRTQSGTIRRAAAFFEADCRARRSPRHGSGGPASPTPAATGIVLFSDGGWCACSWTSSSTRSGTCSRGPC